MWYHDKDREPCLPHLCGFIQVRLKTRHAYRTDLTQDAAQGAYYITSNNEAVVIDPLLSRGTAYPLDHSCQPRWRDHQIHSGNALSCRLCKRSPGPGKKTGATIVYGPNANPSFDALIAKDGQELMVGDVTLKVIHTWPHIMESTCYLLMDEEGKEHSIFTGDTLFIGDVGRPDLAQKAASMTQEELAAFTFPFAAQKIMTLPENVVVYPAHGAGSACGKEHEQRDHVHHRRSEGQQLRPACRYDRSRIRERSDRRFCPLLPISDERGHEPRRLYQL